MSLIGGSMMYDYIYTQRVKYAIRVFDEYLIALNMYLYIYIYIYIYINIFIYTYIYIHIHVNIIINKYTDRIKTISVHYELSNMNNNVLYIYLLIANFK